MAYDASELTEALRVIRDSVDNPEKGLPEDVFLLASELLPLVNTDLLVRDDDGRILLAWRNDRWWGNGWHVPGGVLRLNETFEQRVQKTAVEELHSEVSFSKTPLEICPIIAKQFKERSHHITFVYDCRVPDDYVIDNGELAENDTGYLKWHDVFPDDMLKCHEFYKKYFKK